MSVFVHAQGIKTANAGAGSKNGKILSTQLLNDPLWLLVIQLPVLQPKGPNQVDNKLIFGGEYTVPPPCSNLVENMSLLYSVIVANFNKC